MQILRDDITNWADLGADMMNIVPASRLKESGWKFHAWELIGEPDL